MDMTEDGIQAQFELAEARTEARFAQLIAEMRAGFAALNARVDTLEGRTGVRLDALERVTAGTKTTVIGTGIAVVAVLIAVLSYGQTWFGIGVSTRDIVRATVAEMQIQGVPAPALRH